MAQLSWYNGRNSLELIQKDYTRLIANADVTPKYNLVAKH